ncbi:MAG: hypothetical protein IPK97_04120 [Ahniella sp.]|nr:hypothetical protein [Ahniella sp.]
MSHEPGSQDRRTILLASASATAGIALGLASLGPTKAENVPEKKVEPAVGQPGDFSFLEGEWRIQHRRLKAGTTDTWDEFDGEATCWTILNGVGSIEELRIPSRDFSGMGLRLLDVAKNVWSDFWVNGKSGVLTTPGMTGAFRDGAGVFESDDIHDGKPIKVRGIWDQITATSCRWHQTTSEDGGQSWKPNWYMDWKRVWQSMFNGRL